MWDISGIINTIYGTTTGCPEFKAQDLGAMPAIIYRHTDIYRKLLMKSQKFGCRAMVSKNLWKPLIHKECQ
jgi:hypothetical protein